jgi:O-antigen biosynthesis protein
VRRLGTSRLETSIEAMPKNNTIADALFEPETHAAAILILASAALNKGDARQAFKLADRACRLDAVATVPHLVLRAQTLLDLGDTNAALLDLHAALAIAPEDIHANRRLLEWGKPSERLSAAKLLTGIETDVVFLKAALRTLISNAVAQTIAVQRNGNSVMGWVAWNGLAPLTISTMHLSLQQQFIPADDPAHRLNGIFNNTSDFAFSLTDEFADCVVDVWRNGEVVFSRRLPPTRHAAKSICYSAGVSKTPDSTTTPVKTNVTIIIPVYKNLEITKACIEAASRQVSHPGSKREIIVVNDESPDPALSAYLRSSNLTVIQNTSNLGFAGSVNQALLRVTDGDVLLLNSDAILPAHAIDRLSIAAYSADDIATVTPMSNNGELTSFPIPFAENPFPNEATVQLLNNIEGHADAEAEAVVDLPNGIGFCLYITRRCLDAVGRLPEIYERGYFEDVHFCLDAAAKNLRNVCATNVFVPHYGAQSFGTSKRALVVRNLAILEKLFPNCRADTIAFMRLDPLKQARERFERAWIEQAENIILALAQAEEISTIEDAVERELTANVKLLFLVIDGTSLELRMSGNAGRYSSNIGFNIGTVDGRAEVENFLLGLRINKFVITNPCRTPNWLARILSPANSKIDVLLLGTECRRAANSTEPDPACQCLDAHRRDDECFESPACGNWSRVASWGGQISVVDDAAAMFARKLMPARPVTRLELQVSHTGTTIEPPARRPASKGALGIIPLERSEDCQQLLRTIGATFASSPGIVVLGRSLDDLELMKSANIFVTGPVAIDEFENLARHHGVSRVFLVSTKPVFGHPFQRYLSTADFPLAYFDWSMCGLHGRAGDILLSPAEDDREIAGRIKAWCSAEFAS